MTCFEVNVFKTASGIFNVFKKRIYFSFVKVIILLGGKGGLKFQLILQIVVDGFNIVGASKFLNISIEK